GRRGAAARRGRRAGDTLAGRGLRALPGLRARPPRRARSALESGLEPDLVERRQRALRQTRSRPAGVVDGRGDVVRRVRVEDARERLDLAAADAQLELAAAVHAHPPALAGL